MAFVQVIKESEFQPEELLRLWKDAVYKQDEQIWKAIEFPLHNGQKIVVTKNQRLLLMQNGEVEDCITHPGGYIYHENAEKIMSNVQESYVILNEIVELNADLLQKATYVIIDEDKLCASREEEQLVSQEEITPEDDMIEEKFLFCPSCGMDLRGNDGYLFCPSCGEKLS